MYLGIFLQGIKSFIITPLEGLCSIALYVFTLFKNSWYFPDRPGCLIKGGNKTLSVRHGESHIPHMMLSPILHKDKVCGEELRILCCCFFSLINNAIIQLLTCQPISGQTQSTWTGSSRFKAICERKPSHNSSWEMEPAIRYRQLNAASSCVGSYNPFLSQILLTLGMYTLLLFRAMDTSIFYYILH